MSRRAIFRLLGLGTALCLVSALPAAEPVAGSEAPLASAGPPADPAPAEPGAEPGVRVIPPDAGAVARWCTAEQQGAHALAEGLRRRERELDEAAKTLDLRHAEIAAAEARMVERLAALEAVRAEIDTLLAGADEASEARVTDLVKMVEANRASAAAPIVAELDSALAVRVLDAMNPQKAGKLLAELPPAKAASLAERLARPLPTVEVP